ncbi:MAG: hypothetical protein ACYTHK_06530 [Planctomycetota bacterium]|jgi:hypothetical protein
MTQSADKREVMMRALAVFAPLVLFVGCGNTAKMIDDDDELTWGTPFEDDYAAVVDRARGVVSRDFPLGLDPDRTKEEQGDFWSIWRVDQSVLYRKTTRRRARVKVQDIGEGKVRVGVAIVEQINDNIDNPTVIEEAKWVRKHRLPEEESMMLERIAAPWRKFEASAQYKERHRKTRRKGLRPDLVDATSDVTLEDHKNDTISKPIKITGQDEYGGKQTDEGSHLRKKKKEEDE